MSVEFLKRLDPDLPFYYHTSTNMFYEGPLPGFNEPVESTPQLHRPPRRELIGANVETRVTLAPRGTGSVRATFHNVPVELPPLPNSLSVVTDEHSYSSTCN